jgi:glutamate--cysteine ligase
MNTRDLVPVVSGLFRGGRGRTTRIAVEQEYLVADSATGAAVPIERIDRAARMAAAAPYLGFEPGGQVELSLPCMADPAAVTRTLRGLTDDLRRRLATAGFDIHALPVDSRGIGRTPLQLTTPRYVAMQRHFDTIGPAGRRMMRCTASTQVCLDWWPGRAGAEQWRVLNLAGPFLAAAFARVPDPTGG